MNEQDCKVILALAVCDMNPTKTARVLFVHRNTVLYHIEKVKRITGLDPNNFYDLHKLVNMITEEKDND